MDKRPSTGEKLNNGSPLKPTSLFTGQEQDRQSTVSNVLIYGGNILLTFTAVFCTLGVLTSAFDIVVNTGVLVFIWLSCAVAVSLVSVKYRVKGLLLLFVPVLAIIIFNLTAILDGGMWIAYIITTEYSHWIPFPVLFMEMTHYTDEPTAFVAALGAVIAFMLGFTICLRRSVFTTIAVTVPVVFITFIVTTSQADIIYLLGLVAVYLALLISGCISPDSFKKRAQLATPSFLIAAIIITLTYAITPHGTHTREENIIDLGNRFRTAASQIERVGRFFNFAPNDGSGVGWIGLFGGGHWQFNTENVNIADAGRRHMMNRNLLEITVDEPGTFYIRGYSMEHFDGRSWRNSDLYRPDYFEQLEMAARSRPAYIAELYASLFPDRAPSIVEMEIIRTGDFTLSVQYQPYFTADFLRDDNVLGNVERFYYVSGSVHALARSVEEELALTPMDIISVFAGNYIAYTVAADGSIIVFSMYGEWELLPSEDFLTSDFAHYSEHEFIRNRYLQLWELLPSEVFLASDFALYAEREYIRSRYLQIDEHTAYELRQMASQAGINSDAERVEIVDAVGRLVRSSGSYTLSPGPIPQDEDFALYFLQSLQEGYCVHFATAAVLMLRSLDIPARFVSGYAIRVSPGEVGRPVTVTDMNAHAWVEVYYYDVGWLYLEVTPSAGNTYVPPPRPHSAENATPTPQPSPTPPPPTDYPPNGVNGAATPGAGNQEEHFIMSPWLRNVAIVVLLLGLGIVVLVLRRILMYNNRAKHFVDSDTNASVIYTWRYMEKLSGRKAVVTDDVEELALKARFSQHRITEEERVYVVKFAKKFAVEVYNRKGRLGRMWMKYARALY